MCHGTPLVFLCLAGCFCPLFSTFFGGAIPNSKVQPRQVNSTDFTTVRRWVRISVSVIFWIHKKSTSRWFSVSLDVVWTPNCGTLKIHWFLKGTSTISGTEKTWVILRHTHTHVVGILGEFASHDPKPLHTVNPPHKMPSGTSWNTIDWRKSAPTVILVHRTLMKILMFSRWWFRLCFYPYTCGKDPIWLARSFQMGWFNHQHPPTIVVHGARIRLMVQKSHSQPPWM